MRPATFKRRKVHVIDPPRSLKTRKVPKPVQGATVTKATVSVHVRDEKGKGKESAVPSKDTPNVFRDEHDLPLLPKTFKIIAGSYEKLLYGLEAVFQDGEPGSSVRQLQLKPIFIFPAHVSCVKAVAASPSGGKWLATGSSDEIIKVWDLRRRKEVGGLIHHEGSITYLTFPSRSHLLSASEDGTLCLFRARDWIVLRTLKGHKGRVNHVGVHPSGKLALSVGKDHTLRMWDLMRGKGAASTKLGKEGEVVCWSPSGQRFAVQSGTSIDLFTTNMKLLYTITHPSRVHDVKFFRPAKIEGQPEFLLVAAEDRKATVYELSTSTDAAPRVIAELVGHTNRVKAIDIISVAIPPYADLESATYASTVSSDGLIRVFDLGDVLRAMGAHATEHPVVVEPVTQYDTKGSRLTCITLGDGELVADAQKVGKRKREENEAEADDFPSEVESEGGGRSAGEESKTGKNSSEQDSD